jgi:hypothetical protein
MYPYLYFTKNIFICKDLICIFPFVMILSASRLQNKVPHGFGGIVFPCDYIANAIFAKAWAVPQGDDMAVVTG